MQEGHTQAMGTQKQAVWQTERRRQTDRPTRERQEVCKHCKTDKTDKNTKIMEEKYGRQAGR